MNATSDLPPLIQIACDEQLWVHPSPEALRQALHKRGLDEQLQQQALWTIDEFSYVDSQDAKLSKADFSVFLSGSLNPFAKTGKCMGEECSLNATRDFVRTVGLYADVAIVPDPVTGFFSDDGTPSDWQIFDLFRNLKQLQVVAPFLKSGVVRFSSPRHGYCSACYARKEAVLTELTDSLLQSIQPPEVELCRFDRRPVLAFRIPVLQPDHSHPLTKLVAVSEKEAAAIDRYLSGTKRARSKNTEKLISRKIAKGLESDLSNCFFELEASRGSKSLLLAGSRSEVLVINALDNEPTTVTDLENWESIRTIRLPWIDNLSADEILLLRDQARTALPRLRELLRQRLNEPAKGNKNRMQETVAELRSQALEVDAELEGLDTKREKRYRRGMTGLAASFVIYGMATQSPAVAATSLAALLATLAHLRSAERKHSSTEAKLISTPGYALLKARDILRKRSSRN